MPSVPPCPLCEFASPKPLWDAYFHCSQCDLRFLHPSKFLPANEERARYLNHENDASNSGYRKFLEPLFHAVQAQLKPGAQGLDFGCGPGPTLSRIFAEHDFPCTYYDPFFASNPAPLTRQYDFVTASEVAEHFHAPGKEFGRLFQLLNPGGTLGLMTLLYDVSVDFSAWYYRRDPTHVVFYTRATIEWIARRFGFEDLAFHNERTVTLRRPR